MSLKAQYRHNPFTGLPDRTGTAAPQILVPLGFEADCTVDELVGDPVVFSLTVDNLVERLANNVYGARLVVGIISSKSSDTRCVVIAMGLLEGIGAGFSQGLPVWIGTDGALTTVKPSTGHLQVIGNASSATGMVVNIESRKTIQAP